MRSVATAVVLCLAICCAPPRPSDDATRLPTVPVTFPNGKTIRAELATSPLDQQRGLMFRTSLAPDRGMLFVFSEPAPRPFWMLQTLIPLDIIWMDAAHTIVFVSANTPPCPGQDCPSYGGRQLSQFVLELAAGAAQANGLKVGDRLKF